MSVRSSLIAGPGFVGRADELDRLDDLCRLSATEGAQFVVVSGEAGIGKTTLIETLLSHLRLIGWGNHVGHCIEYSDRPLPFGPVVALLRSVLLGAIDQADELLGSRRADLALLLPELRGDDDAANLTGDQDRLLDAISETLRAAASIRPFVMVIEDIHWADTATLDLVATLARTLDDAPIVLIATERTGTFAPDPDQRTWKAELLRLGCAHELELAEFERAELAAQAEVVLGEKLAEDEIDALVARTGGNAYFAYELLTARDGTQAASLTTSLRDFVAGRLGQLDPDILAVLQGVAVAGGEIAHRVLAEMFDQLDLGPIVRVAIKSEVLDVHDQGYRFRHALMREAIEQELLPFEVEQLHRRIAEALTCGTRRSTSPSGLAKVALHWRAANDAERSIRASWEAARAAASIAAFDIAADMALDALGSWDEVADPTEALDARHEDVLLDAATWLNNCFRGDEAAALIEAALDGWAASRGNHTQALLVAHLIPIFHHLGRPAESATLIERARALVGDDMSTDAARVHNLLAQQAVALGKIGVAAEAAERAFEIAEMHGPVEVLVEATSTRALAEGVTGDRSLSTALFDEARRVAAEHELIWLTALTMRRRWLVVNFHDGYSPECIELIEQGSEFVNRHCGPRWRAFFRYDLANGYSDCGRLIDAEASLMALRDEVSDDLRHLHVLQASALVAIRSSRLDDAHAHVEAAREVASRYQSAQQTGVQARLCAELYRVTGRLGEAVEQVDEALRLQLTSDNISFTRESILEKARIARAMAEANDVRAKHVMRECDELIASFDGRGRLSHAFRELAKFELLRARGTASLEDAARTMQALAETNQLFERAVAHLDVAFMQFDLDAGAHRDEIARELNEAMRLADAHGMAGIAERCVSLARLAQIALDNEPVLDLTDHDVAVVDAPDEPDEQLERWRAAPYFLSKREIEVLGLVAEGMTNKAIGEALFVSPRTVSTHVSNMLTKLNVSNRGEAGALYLRLNPQR